MTHLKNSTTEPDAQLPKLRPCALGPGYSDMFSINENGGLIDALSLAGDLSDGVSQLCGRLDESINNGENLYCAEVRALGFLSDVVAALVRSAERGLKAEGGSAQ